MLKKIMAIMIMVIMVCSLQNVWAACSDYTTNRECGQHGRSCAWENGKCVDNKAIVQGGTTSTTKPNTSTNKNWWEQANSFLSGFKGQGTEIGNTNVGKIMKFLDPIVELVRVVGNMIFVAVTVILGVKYIWGGVESKASVKDSLVTLIVAALVFYGWNTLSALLMNDGNLSFIKGDAETTAQTIYSYVIYIANFLAIGGLVYIGVRYMLAGAEGRAQLKTKGVPVVLGIIMVYATITFLNIIVGLL